MILRLILLLGLPLWMPGAENLLKNESFETLNSAGDLAENWSRGAYQQAEGTVQPDTENVRHGKQSLVMRQASEKGWLGCSQTILLKEPLKSSRKITWSLEVCTDRLKKGQLVITAGTKEKPQKQWVSAMTWQGTAEWKTFSKDLLIEPGADRITFSIRTAGPGTLWADNCSVTMGEDPELLLNGTLSGEILPDTGLPEGWKIKMYQGLEADGNATIEKDAYLGGNAIGLKWRSGARRFGVEADVREIAPGAAVYKISAALKTTDDAKALFGVGLFDAKGNKLDEIFSNPVTSADWRTADFEFHTTPETAGIEIYCLSGETGAVYFANVSCRKLDREAARAALPLAARLQPVEWSKVWNGGKNEFTSFLEAPLPLSFHFKGRKDQLKEAALVLEIPAGLKLEDAFCMHTGNYGREVPRVEKIKRPEGDYNRYIFEDIRPFKILQNEYGWARKLIVVIDSVDKTEKSHKVFWYLRNAGRQGPEETFDFRTASLPPGKLPKDFKIMRWETDDFLYSSDEVLQKAAQILEKSGMNMARRQPENFPRGAAINRMLNSRGWTFKIGTPDYLHPRFFPREYLTRLQGKEELAVKADGSPKAGDFCPDYFTDDPEFGKMFQEFLRDVIRRYDMQPGEMVCMDVEPWGTMDWCFCERSRKKFSEKLKLSHVLKTAEIKEKYSREWIEFRCGNTAKITRMHQEVVKRHFPQLILADYDYVANFKRSDYRSNFSGVPKDPVMNESYFDLHIASYYHYIDKKAFDMIRMNSRALQKGYIPMCAIDQAGGYLTASEIINPEQARLMLLAAAVNGCAGFAIYPGLHLDGQYLRNFSRGMNEIAILEEYFKLGKQDVKEVSVTVRPYQIRKTANGELRFPHWNDHAAFAAIPKGAERLVAVFNYHPKNIMFADINADLPKGNYAVFNPVNQTEYLPESGRRSWSETELKNGILIKVAPRDAGFVLIAPAAPNGAAKPGSTQSDLENEFKQEADKFAGAGAFNAVRSGDLSIELADSNRDGTPELELASPKQKLRIDYARSGAVINWEVQGKTIDNISFLNEKIWLPKESRGNLDTPYTIKHAVISGNQAEAVLVKTFPALSLEIQKTVKINSTEASFQVDYHLKNIGQSSVRPSLWIANLIHGGTPIFYVEQSNKKVEITQKNGVSIYSMTNGIPEGHGSFSGMISSPKSELRSGEHSIEISLAPESLMNYYFWHSPAVNTWEWMYRPETIAPGQSYHTSLTVRSTTE